MALITEYIPPPLGGFIPCLLSWKEETIFRISEFLVRISNYTDVQIDHMGHFLVVSQGLAKNS